MNLDKAFIAKAQVISRHIQRVLSQAAKSPWFELELWRDHLHSLYILFILSFMMVSER